LNGQVLNIPIKKLATHLTRDNLHFWYQVSF